MTKAVGGRKATVIASAGWRKSPGGDEGSASLTLPLKDGMELKVSFLPILMLPPTQHTAVDASALWVLSLHSC